MPSFDERSVHSVATGLERRVLSQAKFLPRSSLNDAMDSSNVARGLMKKPSCAFQVADMSSRTGGRGRHRVRTLGQSIE